MSELCSYSGLQLPSMWVLAEHRSSDLLSVALPSCSFLRMLSATLSVLLL